MIDIDVNRFVAALNQKEYPKYGRVKIKEHDKYGFPKWVHPIYDYSDYQEDDWNTKKCECCKRQIKRTGFVHYEEDGKIIKSESYYKQT